MKRSWLRPALLAATVLLHLGALVLVLSPSSSRRDKSPAPAMDVVWVRTPPPPPPVVQVAPAPSSPARAPRRTPRAAARPAPAAAESTLVAVPSASVPAEPAAEAAPDFDRDQAINAARRIAREVDPVLPGTKYAETREERLGKAIASAKRPSCLKGNGGGNLLTPLMWLLEKKDSGCKF
jgi:hypothetical protein